MNIGESLFLTAQIRDLEHQISWFQEEGGGIGILYGDYGTGKTLTSRYLQDRMDPTRYKKVGLMPPIPGLRALYRILLFALGEIPRGLAADLRLQWEETARSLGRQGYRISITVDEAQDLPIPVLLGIRGLLTTGDGSPLAGSVLLIGTQALPQKLQSAPLEPLLQRVSLRYHLTAWTRQEADEYVLRHLTLAGTSLVPTVSPEALAKLFHHTRGIPRLLHAACRQLVRRLPEGTVGEADIDQALRYASMPGGAA